METDSLTQRQKGTLCLAAGLSPAVSLLPRQTAVPWGFLVPVGLLLLYTLLLWLLRRRESGLLPVLGTTGPGRAVLGLEGLWCAVLFAAVCPLAARRVSAAAYGGKNTVFFLTVLGLTAAALSLCRLKTLGRLGELLLLPVAAGLLLTLPFSFSSGDWQAALAPPDPAALGMCLIQSLPATLALPVLLLLFPSAAKRCDPGPRRGLWWGMALLCALLVLLLLAELTMLTPSGAAALPDPLITLLKSLPLLGMVERAEAVAVSVLVYGDVLLLTALAMLSGVLLSQSLGWGRRNLWSLAAAAGGLLAALFLPEVSPQVLLWGCWGSCLLPLLPLGRKKQHRTEF